MILSTVMMEMIGCLAIKATTNYGAELVLIYLDLLLILDHPMCMILRVLKGTEFFQIQVAD